MSGSSGTLTFGDTHGADEQWVGDVPGNFSLTGLTDINETRSVSNGGSFGGDTGGEHFAPNPLARPTVRHDFDTAEFGMSISTDRDLGALAGGRRLLGRLRRRELEPGRRLLRLRELHHGGRPGLGVIDSCGRPFRPASSGRRG